jgi:Dehydrogenases with different specificities (related to short-chain alcohol dehydrogenases)
MKNIVAVVAVAMLVACASAAVRFKDKVVLVTGGSRGIGYQTALQFAQEGAKVILVSRDIHASLDKAKNQINDDKDVKENGGAAFSYKADLTDYGQVTKLFDYIKSDAGLEKIDIAINGAGISGPLGKMGTMEYTFTENDPVMNNVYATLNCLTKEEEMMVLTNTSGVIITIDAVEGLIPSSLAPRFAASKYALIGLSHSIALRHITGIDGPYIRTNLVCPGPTATTQLFNKAKFYTDKHQQPWEGEDLTEDSKVWKDHESNFTAHVPMGRIARPSEIANTILWLCTDDALHISGDAISVDGGMWAI